MKKLMIALVAVLAVTCVTRFSLADKDVQKISGVLIDAKCGKGKNEEKASGHKAACCLSCAKGGSAMQIISGDKTYKLDDASKDKAIEYLTNEKGDGTTHVVVEGTLKEDTLTISSIKKAEKKEG
jgi:hypothetical protein